MICICKSRYLPQPYKSKHANGNDISTKFVLLIALKVVMLTFSVALCNDICAKMTTFLSWCVCFHTFPIAPAILHKLYLLVMPHPVGFKLWYKLPSFEFRSQSEKAKLKQKRIALTIYFACVVWNMYKFPPSRLRSRCVWDSLQMALLYSGGDQRNECINWALPMPSARTHLYVALHCFTDSFHTNNGRHSPPKPPWLCSGLVWCNDGVITAMQSGRTPFY